VRRLLILGLVTALATVLLVPTAAFAKANKVDVCHLNDLGEWQVNSVSGNGNAVQAHLNHGDGLPGDPVPEMEGYSFDDNCVPVSDGDPGIDIEKLTNGNDADGANDADVPQLAPGETVVWTYNVENTGDISFLGAVVVVTDDVLGVIAGPASGDANNNGSLDPGETWVYEASSVADALTSSSSTTVPGCGDDRPTYENVGGVDVPGASDSDPSHYCNPPETIFAVAYTDINESDGGYNPAVDVLIAKLVDGPVASPDGVIGVGDIVVTDRYPKAYDGSLFGVFLVNTHTVTSVIPPTSVELFVFAGDDLFRWNDGPPFDQYVEDVDDDTTFFVDVHFDPGAGSEQLIADPGSPSSPDETSIFIFNRPGQETDDAFIDVEITLP